jgi:hypothetical protein
MRRIRDHDPEYYQDKNSNLARRPVSRSPLKRIEQVSAPDIKTDRQRNLGDYKQHKHPSQEARSPALLIGPICARKSDEADEEP